MILISYLIFQSHDAVVSQLYYFFYIDIIDRHNMDNIYLNKVKELPHAVHNIRKISYQTATDSLILLHSTTITKFTFNNKNYHFEQIYSTPHIEQLQTESLLLVEQLVDNETVLVVTGDGSIFTVAKDGEVDIKAQNQDGIASASLSPTQQYLYIVTNNNSLIQLNKQFDLVNQIPIDEQQEVVNSEAQFSWRPDGNFFILNYKTVYGNKAVTKDIMMNTFISPAKSDPNADGLVQSVSERGKPTMSPLVAWQPSGSIVAGVDYIEKGETKTNRVILWQKNGLRHLEFNLKADVQTVDSLFWSFDSSILFVEVHTTQSKRQLLLFYRSNYHWYLKNVIALNAADHCFLLNSRQQKHKLLVVHSDKFQVLEYQTRLPEKEFKHAEEQKVYKNQFQYFVDGPVVNITDLSKCFMPPPMSMYKYDFGSNITATHKDKHNIVVVTLQKVFLYDCLKTAVVQECSIGELKDKRIYDLHLLKNDQISVTIGERRYDNVEGELKYAKKIEKEELTYKITSNQNVIQLKIAYNNQELTINSNTISDECSSFIIYHEFLLFTVSTSHMYDKLYVINFALEDWLQKADCNPKNKLSDYETRDTLNHRLTERGSKIIAVTEGRVVFQLPRGNLEGVYPKIIMIDRVKKCLESRRYRQAFETVRTHKLDFNLLYDINPQAFREDIENLLVDLKRVDYINLLITQITETYSSQMQYILSAKTYETNRSDFEMSAKGKKVRTVCGIISKALRSINKDEYILSIYTSEIRQSKLKDVLFEIKQLKRNEVEVVVPPHIVQNQQKKKKKVLSPQQILQYVCWLVDANAIYQASLLTYDLELAAITARCTQKDPKQYMPYHEQLKQIQNPIDFKKKICLDLKKYAIAARELAQGTPQQVEQSLQLIKKHKLYKDGLIIYSNKPELKSVKEFIVEQLLATGQTNEAYRVCQSIGLYERALSIAKGSMDTKKIKQSLEIVLPKQQRKAAALEIISEIKEQIKNRIELARLYAYVEQYEEAVRIYLKHNEYRKAYKYISKVGEEFKSTQMKEGFQLCFSVKRNDIIRDKKDFLEKYTRLKKLHKHKAQFGQPTSFRPRENDDMYSEVSMSSKAQSSYTISTTTGMRKKKDKKRSILTRNVKQGSPLEQEYLLAYIKTLEEKVQDAVKDAKLLIQHLICVNLVQQAESMRNQVREYIETFSTYRAKSFARTKYEELHPQAAQLYYQLPKFQTITIDSFNYLF